MSMHAPIWCTDMMAMSTSGRNSLCVESFSLMHMDRALNPAHGMFCARVATGDDSVLCMKADGGDTFLWQKNDCAMLSGITVFELILNGFPTNQVSQIRAQWCSHVCMSTWTCVLLLRSVGMPPTGSRIQTCMFKFQFLH